MYYLGDPCYIIPDDQWNEFCELTFKHEGGDGYHLDSVINWHGQEITIWSNGGDGCWEFDTAASGNGAKSFGVDAGIFCVIDIDQLPRYENDPADMGMTFHEEPDLYVKDDVIYINDEPDLSVTNCPSYRCGRQVISWHEIESCEYGNCEEGCSYCFECSCCGKCGEEESYCDCGDEE